MGNTERSESSTSPGSEVDVPLDVIPLHSTNLLTVLDESGTILYESPSIERIFGYDQNELIDEQVAEYFHPDDRERVIGAFEAVVESDEYIVESVEYRHEQVDGSYLWVESVASADQTPEGHYVVNTRDVSDRIERKRNLERSNERLDEFASVISHDLRSPLNVAQGRMQLVRETCDSEHIDEVIRAHEWMESLIENLLTLAQSGKRVQNVEPVDLATLAETSWQTVETADANLVVDVDRPILADPSRIRQLLENLMRNAVELGGERVTVTIGELDDYAGFYVADDGPGVPEEKREWVFERGYTTRDDGAGFGLTIVNDIAEAHDWSITLTESSASGARFEFVGVEFQ